MKYYLKVFELYDKRDKLISELSRGMLQKTLTIAIFNYIINNYTYDIITIVLVLFIVVSAVIYQYTTKFITKRIMSYDIS